VIIVYLLSFSAMSSQKLQFSYSSLRRQIKAQVAADINFITNCHDDVDDDNNDYDMENESEQPCDSVTFPVFETKGGCNSAGVCNCRSDTDHYVRSYSLTQLHADFDNYHWVSSDSDDEDGTVESDVISKQLNAWVVKYLVSQCAVIALLGILKPHIPCLPSDARTLMNTLRSCGIKSLKNGGKYCHFGLLKGLNELLKPSDCAGTTCLKLQFNIDGVPLFKSST